MLLYLVTWASMINSVATQGWVATQRGSSDDQVQGMDTDSQGNVVAVGYFQSASLTISDIGGSSAASITNVRSGYYDGFVTKYSSNGSLLWAACHGGIGDDYSYGVAIDQLDNVYIAGASGSPLLSIYNAQGKNVSYLVGIGLGTGYVIKLSSSGQFIWAVKQDTNQQYDYASGVAVDTSNNIFVVGYYPPATLNMYDASGANVKSVVNGGNYASFVAKYFANGSFVWVARQDGAQSEDYGRVATDQFGNVYVAFESTSSTNVLIYDPAGTNVKTLPEVGNGASYMVKYASNGAFVWATRQDGNFYDYPNGVAVDIQSNVYVTGYHGSTPLFLYDKNGVSAGSVTTSTHAAFLVKYFNNGSFAWVINIDQSAFGYAVTTDFQGNVIVGGYFSDTTLYINDRFGVLQSQLSNVLSGSQAAFTVKYNSNGQYIWAIRQDGTGNEGIIALTTDYLGNVFVGGSFTSTNCAIYDSSGASVALMSPNGGNDGFVVKYNSNGIFLTSTSAVTTGTSTAQVIGTSTVVNSQTSAVVSTTTIVSTSTIGPVFSGTSTSPSVSSPIISSTSTTRSSTTVSFPATTVVQTGFSTTQSITTGTVQSTKSSSTSTPTTSVLSGSSSSSVSRSQTSTTSTLSTSVSSQRSSSQFTSTALPVLQQSGSPSSTTSKQIFTSSLYGVDSQVATSNYQTFTQSQLLLILQSQTQAHVSEAYTSITIATHENTILGIALNTQLLFIVVAAVASLVVCLCIAFCCLRQKKAKRRVWQDLVSTDHTAVTQSSYAGDPTTVFTSTAQVTTHVLTVPKFLMLQFGIHFRQLQIIAKGGGGSIYLCQVLDSSGIPSYDGAALVVKNLGSYVDSLTNTVRTSFYQEVAMLYLFRDQPYFARLYGFTEEPATILLKYYELGSLKHYILAEDKASKKFKYSKRQYMHLITQLSQGFNFMHLKQFAHCDIKPDNVLLEKVKGILEPRITDFGISRLTDVSASQVKQFKISEIKGASLIYAAPESISRLREGFIESNPAVWKAGDVYSMSALMLQMLTRTSLWG